ncbi:MAG: threonine/serine ThrE exporter family protein [Cyclobacteriaceae bacterium]
MEYNNKHDTETLADSVDLMLWAGQLLLKYGADSLRVERSVLQLGRGLNVEATDIFISHNSIMITTSWKKGFRTRIRNVKKHGINFTIISALSKLSFKAKDGNLTSEEVRNELQRIENIKSHYPRWMVIMMVGLACASFSQLFGGDWPIFAITFAAASVGMWLRQELVHREYNLYIVVIAVAFSASIIAGLASYFNWSADPALGLAASVLLLVPGVPMINSVKDIMYNYTMVGLTRAIIGIIVSFCIAIGLILSMTLIGLKSL